MTTKQKTLPCDHCGGKTSVQTVEIDRIVDGIEVQLFSPGFKCATCKREYLDPDQRQAIDQKVQEELERLKSLNS